MVMALRATPRAPDNHLTSASLALPSMGWACSLIFRASPCTPITSVFFAFAWTNG